MRTIVHGWPNPSAPQRGDVPLRVCDQLKPPSFSTISVLRRNCIRSNPISWTMRSLVGLKALVLALAGLQDVALAKKTCKPRSSGQGTSLTTAQTATITPSAGGLAPRGVPNIVVNGNFVGYDPSVAGGIYGFETDGDARQVTGLGYTGDNSQETACAYFTVPDSRNTNTGVSKRDGVESPQVASIRQWLKSTDRESVYTMRVWYYVDYNKLADTCKLVAIYDNNVFVESPYFPVVAKDSGSFSWSPLIQQSPVLSDSGYLKFEVQCTGGGAADVRFDQVFFTNEVSLRDLDDITVIYSSFADTPTVPPTISSTATSPASATAVLSTGSSAAAASSTVPGSTASSGTIASSATGSGTQIASSTSSLPPSTSSSVVGDNTCIVLGQASVAGRGCAKRPYSGSSGYKTFPNPDITKDQCAALCLSDARCQSFQWSTQGSGCQNYCSLLETSLSAGSADNGGNGSPWAYDRSCITQSTCPQAPADTVCVNGQGNTPGAGCTQFQGVAKACATPFMTASMSLVCGVGNGCRDLCAQTPSCKSYSYSYDGTNNCKLYSASAATVGTAQGSGSILFADASCSACGTGMSQFKYLPKLSDPSDMPILNCPDPSATPASSLAPTTTTQYSPSTASSCPQYIAAPGMCYGATPTAVGSVCNKRGTNSNTYTKSLDEVPNQSMSEYCALACDSDPECKSYAWDYNLSPFSCQFSKKTVTDNIAADLFIPSEMANQRWYDIGCMRCVHCGTTPQSSALASSSSASSTIPSASTTTAAASTPQNTCPGGLACTAKTFAPAGVYCKQQGQFSGLISASVPDAVEFPQKATSAEECASICSQTTNCLASSFSVVQGCGLITQALAQASFVPGSSSDSWGTVWSDNACFDCAACGTAASSTVATPISTTSSTIPAATSTGSSTASPTDCFGLSCRITSPIASGVYCRQPGDFQEDIGVWNPDPVKFPLKPITVEQCAAICLQDSRCKASSMTSRGLCQLFDRTLSAAHFTPSTVKSKDVWSDNACFECSSCSSTSTSIALVSSTVLPSTTTTPTPSSTTDGCPTWLPGPGGCVHSTPFPSGYVCDVKGTIPSSSVYTYSLAVQPLQRGFGDCAWICFNDPSCKTYGWVSGSSSGCKFSTMALDGLLTTDSTSDTRWFNMNCPQCYSCPNKPPLSTKTPVSTSPLSMSTPTTFGTITTPDSSSTDFISSSSGEPLITPYPPMTATTTAATTTTTAPIAAQTCLVPAAVLPDDATCGIPGNGGQQLMTYRLDNYVIKPVGSLAACAKDCLARADCLGFSYTKDDTSCRPYRRGTSDLGITYVSSNSIRYYDRACFTCPS